MTTWHSTPFVSPGLRPPPLPHCAERHAVLRPPALWVHKDIDSSQANKAGCRGRRDGWCNEVKEEQRAQPSAGDMSGTICPGVLGLPQAVPTRSAYRCVVAIGDAALSVGFGHLFALTTGRCTVAQFDQGLNVKSAQFESAGGATPVASIDVTDVSLRQQSVALS